MNNLIANWFYDLVYRIFGWRKQPMDEARAKEISGKYRKLEYSQKWKDGDRLWA
jgi:hypothetical protein